MTTLHPDIKNRIKAWQDELRDLTGDEKLLLFAIHPPKRAIPIEVITEIVCEETGIPQKKIHVRLRESEVALTRHLIAFFARIYTRLPLKKIGSHLGVADHARVIYGSERITELIETEDKRIVSLVTQIESRIKDYINKRL